MTSQPTMSRQAATIGEPRPRRWSIAEWLARWRDRQVLRDLGDATLRDIGLTRDDVEREINRPSWPH